MLTERHYVNVDNVLSVEQPSPDVSTFVRITMAGGLATDVEGLTIEDVVSILEGTEDE